MAKMDEKLEQIYQDILKRNPGEVEFHQAVREVLESVGPVVGARPPAVPPFVDTVYSVR